MEAQIISSMKLSEAWDVLNAMKQFIDDDTTKGQKVRTVLETHPQLMSAINEIQVCFFCVLLCCDKSMI